MSSFIIADLGDAEAHSSRVKNSVSSLEAAAGRDELEDDVLLGRFLALRDADAFETLVLRHGPAVMGVCRRWLGSGQQSDDAFQATFLILINRAAAIRRKENIGAWLQGVARRVAGRLKTEAERRRKREGAVVDIHEVAAAAPAPLFDDLGDVVRQEVERLPEAYRNPIVLCYWEGLSSEQAAERLCCPTGTLKWRLVRARDLLRQRLSKLSLGLVMFLMGRRSLTANAVELSPSASVPDALSPLILDAGEALVPLTLLSKTVAIALYLRDNLMVVPLQETMRSDKRRRPLGFWIWAGTWFIAAAIASVIGFNPVVRHAASASLSAMFAPASAPSCH